ncbi:MAG: T9SS type A sorting domain-containing protein [Bacteroidota bacterium]
MEIKKVIISTLALFLGVLTFAQKEKEGIPLSLETTSMNRKLKQDIPVIQMPKLGQSSIDEIKKRNSELNGEIFQFAHGFDVNINIKKNAIVDSLENGLLYRLKIKSMGAKSLNVIFGVYEVPEDATLFIYDEGYNYILGMFSNHNNKKNNRLAVESISTEQITIEYFEPFNIELNNNLIINKVSHGIYDSEDGFFGGSGNCQVDINCSEGNTWQDEKKSVVRLLINGTGLCTGVLLNNTSQDATPYVLTAAHCICNQANAENTVYTFNYESPSCDGSDGSVSRSISGADLRSTSLTSDFTLLELSEVPDQSYDVYYAGWDRRNNATTGGVGIHHPMGDVKKIATYNTQLVNSTCMNFNYNNGCEAVNLPNADFWEVNWMATANGHSVTEGGSSGSPLFNNASRVVGQLWGAGSCNNANCSNPTTDTANYGKIFASWDGANDTVRLRDWLDPCGTGAITTNGWDPPTLSTPSTVSCTGTNFQVFNLPAGSTISWSHSANISRTSPQGSNPCTFTSTGVIGSAWVRATITSANGCANPYVIQSNTTSSGGSTTSISLSVNGPASDGWINASVSGGSSPYNWTLNSNTTWTTSVPYTTRYVGCNGAYLHVSAQGTCGTATASQYIYPCTGGYYRTTVYPNPTSDEINVVESEEYKTADDYTPVLVGTVELTLLDFSGNPVKLKELDGKREDVKLNVSSLSSGNYFLLVKSGKIEETHQIIIE